MKSRRPAETVARGVGLALALFAGALVPAVAGPAAPPDGLHPATAAMLKQEAARPGAAATLLNVWATWCLPCRQEFPEIVRLGAEHRDEGLRVLFVSADLPEAWDAAVAFLTEQKAPRPWYVKDEGDMAFINGLDSRWSGTLPATFVFGRDGALRHFHEGQVEAARLEEWVADALRTAPVDGALRTKEER